MTSRPETVERDTTAGSVPTDSEPLEEALPKDTVGGLSSSVMVRVCSAVPPIVALPALLKVTCTVSAASSRLSSDRDTVMFFSVCPAVNVRVPEARM